MLKTNQEETVRRSRAEHRPVLRHRNQNPNQFNSIIRPARPVSEVLTQAIHQARPGNIITAGSTGMELGFYLTTGYGIAINGYSSPPSDQVVGQAVG